MATISDFARARVLCVGDVMVDYFIYGSVDRISPEAPVPVLSSADVKIYPGGAANVARNIISMGGKCTLIGVVGTDEAAATLRERLRKDKAIRPILIDAPDRITTQKRRFISQGQQILRVDRECKTPISDAITTRVLEQVQQNIARNDIVVISDYAKGAISNSLAGKIIRLAKEFSRLVIVDPKKPQFDSYAGADIIIPNAKELSAATGVEFTIEKDKIAAAAKVVTDKCNSRAVIVTLAEHGAALARPGCSVVFFPSNVREVCDVAGAGDTFVASIAVALSAGFDLEPATQLANSAAGIAVGCQGTSTVTGSDLARELAEHGMAGRPLDSVDKILDETQLATKLGAWRDEGRRVGFTNGCFDLLHVGHIALLEYARKNCDRLIVGLNSDRSTSKIKGQERPINQQEDRALLLAALGSVDAVIIFDEDTPRKLIEQIRPSVLVKGSDYSIDDIVGADIVLNEGGKVLRFERVRQKSTSDLIRKIRAD